MATVPIRTQQSKVWVTNNFTNSSIPTSVPSSSNFQLINSASTIINTTNQLTISQFTNEQDGYSYVDEIRRILHGRGVELEDGSRLVIRDGMPLITHRHTDGSEKMRPVPVSHYGVLDFSDTDHRFAPGTVMKLPDGTILQIDQDGKLIHETFINAHHKVVDVSGGPMCLYESLAFCHFSEIHIPDGAKTDATFVLPNGVTITLFPDDHVEIDESNGRQLYRTEPVRGFNKFLNASDLLEDFIKFCGSQNVTRKDFAELPVSLFIYWLIVQAAEADGDATDESVPLLTSAVKQQQFKPHRCNCCGKFLSSKMKEHGINFCSSDHMQRYMDKL